MTEPLSAPAAADLGVAGWAPGRQVPEPTAEAIELVCRHVGRHGERHEPFPAAVDALTEFGGLAVSTDRAGVAVAPQPFVLDPTLAAATTETLADLGRVLDVRLFPLGLHGEQEAVLAIDERGRVFVLDDTGDWLVGDTIHAALDALLTGRAPVRVRDDGTLDDTRRHNPQDHDTQDHDTRDDGRR